MPSRELVDKSELIARLTNRFEQDKGLRNRIAQKINSPSSNPEKLAEYIGSLDNKVIANVAQQALSTVFIFDKGKLVADHYCLDAEGRIVLDKPDASPEFEGTAAPRM